MSENSPDWTAECFIPHDPDAVPDPSTATPVGVPAPRFVGMNRATVDRLAAEEHFRVVVVAEAGSCIPWSYGLVMSRHLYIALDGNGRVVAARSDWIPDP
jgi:hypothetical protein